MPPLSVSEGAQARVIVAFRESAIRQVTLEGVVHARSSAAAQGLGQSGALAGPLVQDAGGRALTQDTYQ